MGAGWRLPFFTARLRPHRSLPRRGRLAVLAVFGLFQGTLGVAFGLAGAWPVAFFLALTWFGLALAFARNARAARAYEDIALSPYELHYARVSPAGARRDWQFNPLWVRLAVERHAEFGVAGLTCLRVMIGWKSAPFLARTRKPFWARI